MSTELERARQEVDSFMHIVKDCDCDDCIVKRDKRAEFERLVRGDERSKESKKLRRPVEARWMYVLAQA